MANHKKCCGTCEYGSYDKTDGYVCVNDNSEYVADLLNIIMAAIPGKKSLENL